MAASDSAFPGAADSFDDKTSADYANASDMNAVQDGLMAVQIELGTDPALSDTDVKTLLAKTVAYGTSFPGSPTTGDRFFRTDLVWLCYYDGTRWLTAHEFATPMEYINGNTTDGLYYLPSSIRADYAIYFTRVAIRTFVATTNDGSKYWTVTVRSTGPGATTIRTFTTASDSADAWVDHSAAPSNNPPANYGVSDQYLVKTSTPGAISTMCTLYYRLIVT